MMSVIRIHYYECPVAIEFFLLWRYTLSSRHLRLIDIVPHQLGDTS
jgi:hypothetical protein